MKKILTILTTLVIINTGCTKFLEKTPSEGGLVGFNNVNQFDALLNDLQLTRNRFEWNHTMYASDDCFYHPDFQTAAPSTYQQREAINVWNNNELRGLSTNTGFQRAWSQMYTFNFIIDKINESNIEGSELLKKQVKAEALFFRAFLFFNMSVQYCMHPGLNNGQYPGLGYKNTISIEPSTYNDRGTVSATLEGVIKDLQTAEQLLNEAGKGDFNINQSWRATVVTVQSLIARVELYMGNYQKAFEYAKKAFTAYNFLYDMNNASLFANQNRTTVTSLCGTANSTVISQSPIIAAAGGSTTDPNSLWNYKESYFRYVCQIAAIDKLPPSMELYSLYDAVDLRKRLFYDNNMNATNSPFTPCRKDELISKSYMKHAIGSTRSGYLLGVSVPEIMLIMAECRARNAGDGENASIILKELRRRRFPTNFVDNITGSLNDVKDERRRELAFVMRWYDLKRYNALDNANITISKLARQDVYQLGSPIVTYKLAPNGLAYAQPIPEIEISLLTGWKQNEDGGVTKQ